MVIKPSSRTITLPSQEFLSSRMRRDVERNFGRAHADRPPMLERVAGAATQRAIPRGPDIACLDNRNAGMPPHRPARIPCVETCRPALILFGQLSPSADAGDLNCRKGGHAVRDEMERLTFRALERARRFPLPSPASGPASPMACSLDSRVSGR